MRVVRPDLMPDFVRFANRYCEPHKKSNGVHYNGASFTEELQMIFNKRFGVRRLRHDLKAIEKLPQQ